MEKRKGRALYYRLDLIVEIIMRLLDTVEIEYVTGAGWFGELVDDVKNADFEGAYENIVGAVTHIIGRVAKALR